MVFKQHYRVAFRLGTYEWFRTSWMESRDKAEALYDHVQNWPGVNLARVESMELALSTSNQSVEVTCLQCGETYTAHSDREQKVCANCGDDPYMESLEDAFAEGDDGDEHSWDHAGVVTGESHPVVGEGVEIDILTCQDCGKQTVGDGNGREHPDWGAGTCKPDDGGEN